MTTTYNFYEDPGHGWLQVPLAEIRRLKINPSPYSYRDKNNAYLEEDADAAMWTHAKDATGEKFKINFIRTNEPSFVRSLPNY